MKTWIPMGNAFCWLFVQLIGGWKRVIGWCVLYAAILVASWMFWARMNSDAPLADNAGQALTFLGYAQMGILLLGGMSAIGRSISRDQRSRMFESHRLTPVSDAGVVIGYLLGPTFQFLTAFLIGVVFGLILNGIAGWKFDQWLLGNGFLLLTALHIWSFVVFAGMIFPKGGNPSGVMMGLGFVSFFWMAAFPGAGLLLGLYSALYSQLLMNGRPGTLPQVAGLLAFFSALMTAVWLMAAVKKFRRPDLPTLDAARGMLLLMLWLVASIVGIIAFQSIPTGPFEGRQLTVLHAAAFALGSLALGIIPLNSAIHACVRAIRGGDPYDFTDRIPPWLVILVAVPLIVISLGILEWYCRTQAIPPTQLVDSTNKALLVTGVSLLLGYVTLDGVLRLQARVQSIMLVTILFIVFVWGIAPGLDFYWANLRAEMSPVQLRDDEQLAFTWLMGCSPIGTLITTWTKHEIPLVPGFIVQAAIAIGAQVLGWRFLSVEKLRRYREVEATVSLGRPV